MIPREKREWLCTIVLESGTKLYAHTKNIYTANGVEYTFVAIWQRWQNAVNRSYNWYSKESTPFEVPKKARGITFTFEGDPPTHETFSNIKTIVWEPV